MQKVQRLIVYHQNSDEADTSAQYKTLIFIYLSGYRESRKSKDGDDIMPTMKTLTCENCGNEFEVLAKRKTARFVLKGVQYLLDKNT